MVRMDMLRHLRMHSSVLAQFGGTVTSDMQHMLAHQIRNLISKFIYILFALGRCTWLVSPKYLKVYSI